MIITRTPFRVSFVGGGTDLRDFYRSEPGAVVTTAINKYIHKAWLNDKPLNVPWFSHWDLINGGKLRLEMGAYPDKEWGKIENLNTILSGVCTM